MEFPDPPADLAKPIPKQVLDSIYAPVGSLVINWALLEQSIEFWVALIYHKPGCSLGWRKLPFNRAEKLRYLSEAFEKIPSLKPYSEEATAILKKTEAICFIRDTLVHGTISSYDPDTDELRFHRLPIDKSENKHSIDAQFMTRMQILEAGGHMLALVTQSLNFAHRVANEWL